MVPNLLLKYFPFSVCYWKMKNRWKEFRNKEKKKILFSTMDMVNFLFNAFMGIVYRNQPGNTKKCR